MDFLANIYQKTLAESEKNVRFWEDYLKSLESLDFTTFADKLRVPVLVPVGNRILFRGELKHTNEVTVALGADYFTKCSVKQAEVLRQHRIKDAKYKLDALKKEKEYIENQVSFKKDNIFGEQEQEIIEVHTEEEDRAWREKHRQNMRKWKQETSKKKSKNEMDETTDEELWNRLEELELQEELEDELNKSVSKEESFVVKEENIFNKLKEPLGEINDACKVEEDMKSDESGHKSEKKVKFIDAEVPKTLGKLELLQKVIDKQNELEDKLYQLRNKERSKSKTEEDLIAKLDEMEKLDELEDEMERLEDIIETEDVTSEEELEEDNSEENSQLSPQVDTKRRVSFADEDNSETLELTFHHSEVEASNQPYDSKKGITKPSDIYEAFASNFTETTSILKKTKYVDKDSDIEPPKVEIKDKNTLKWSDDGSMEKRRTIDVKDIIEKVDVNDNKLESTEKRPISLFKQRRQQRK